MAAAEVGNESLTDAVHERAAKKDGNAARTRVGVNISEVSLFDLCRIEGQYPFGLIVTDRNSVQLEQLPHNFDITNLWYVAYNTGAFPQECGNHCFGYEVLCSPYGNLSAKRTTAI